MAEDETIENIIRCIDDPVFIVIPNRVMPDEEYVKLYNTLKTVLEEIEKKTKMTFEISVESATYFGGYKEMTELAQDQLDSDDGTIPEDSEQ